MTDFLFGRRRPSFKGKTILTKQAVSPWGILTIYDVDIKGTILGKH